MWTVKMEGDFKVFFRLGTPYINTIVVVSPHWEPGGTEVVGTGTAVIAALKVE